MKSKKNSLLPKLPDGGRLTGESWEQYMRRRRSEEKDRKYTLLKAKQRNPDRPSWANYDDSMDYDDRDKMLDLKEKAYLELKRMNSHVYNDADYAKTVFDRLVKEYKQIAAPYGGEILESHGLPRALGRYEDKYKNIEKRITPLEAKAMTKEFNNFGGIPPKEVVGYNRLRSEGRTRIYEKPGFEKKPTASQFATDKLGSPVPVPEVRKGTERDTSIDWKYADGGMLNGIGQGILSGIGNAILPGIGGMLLPQLGNMLTKGKNPFKLYNDGGYLIQYSGPKHEKGGILVNQNGKKDDVNPIAEVEGGESGLKTKSGVYVFSDHLVNPASGNTFSKDAKRINNKYKGTDRMAVNARKKEYAKLQGLNEAVRTQTDSGLLPKFDVGGKLGKGEISNTVATDQELQLGKSLMTSSSKPKTESALPKPEIKKPVEKSQAKSTTNSTPVTQKKTTDIKTAQYPVTNTKPKSVSAKQRELSNEELKTIKQQFPNFDPNEWRRHSQSVQVTSSPIETALFGFLGAKGLVTTVGQGVKILKALGAAKKEKAQAYDDLVSQLVDSAKAPNKGTVSEAKIPQRFLPAKIEQPKLPAMAPSGSRQLTPSMQGKVPAKQEVPDIKTYYISGELPSGVKPYNQYDDLFETVFAPKTPYRSTVKSNKLKSGQEVKGLPENPYMQRLDEMIEGVTRLPGKSGKVKTPKNKYTRILDEHLQRNAEVPVSNPIPAKPLTKKQQYDKLFGFKNGGQLPKFDPGGPLSWGQGTQFNINSGNPLMGRMNVNQMLEGENGPAYINPMTSMLPSISTLKQTLTPNGNGLFSKTGLQYKDGKLAGANVTPMLNKDGVTTINPGSIDVTAGRSNPLSQSTIGGLMKAGAYGMNLMDALRKPEREKLQLPDFGKGNRLVQGTGMSMEPMRQEINMQANKALDMAKSASGSFGQYMSRANSILGQSGKQLAESQLSQKQYNDQLALTKAGRQDQLSQLNQTERIRKQNADSANVAMKQDAVANFYTNLNNLGTEFQKQDYLKNELANMSQKQKQDFMVKLATANAINPNFQIDKEALAKALSEDNLEGIMKAIIFVNRNGGLIPKLK